MLTLAGSDSQLVVQWPLWLAGLLLAAALAIVAFVVLRKPARPWRLGGYLGTIVLLYGGWYMFANSATFERRGFYIDGTWGEEERVGWSQVSSVDAKSVPGHMVLMLKSTREVVVDLSGLSDEDRARVVAYVQARLKR